MADEVIYLLEETAIRWASLLDAWRRATTWGEFWQAIDAEAQEHIEAAYDGEPMPAPDDALRDEDIPGMPDMLWPGEANVEMAKLPEDAISAFGTEGDSPMANGYFFKAKDIPDINETIEREGGHVRRDDLLVIRAMWRDKVLEL